MTNYNGNAANVAGQTQVTVSNPQDGDAFTAAHDTVRTNTLADWMQLVQAAFSAAYSWVYAQTFQALATFSAGLTSAGPTTLNGTTTIAHMTPLVVGGTGVAFKNSYVAGGVPPRYWKDALGVVHFDGDVTRTTAATTIAFTMPAGYLPGASNVHYFMAQDVSTGLAVTVNVTPAGDVTIQIPNNNDTISISGITFPTF